MKSMTGYGQAEKEIATCHIIVEISSLNKRGLDLFLDLPSDLFSLQLALRKQLTRKAFRGRVHLKLRSEPIEKDLPLQKSFVEKLQEWGDAMGSERNLR